MDLIKSGKYIDILLCQNMLNNKNKYSGGVSCSSCNAVIREGIMGSPLFTTDLPSLKKTNLIPIFVLFA